MQHGDRTIRTATIHVSRDNTKWYVDEVLEYEPRTGYRRVFRLKSKDLNGSEQKHGVLMKTDWYPTATEVPKLDIGHARAKAMKEEIL